jgi:hypothetical protein
VHLDVIKVFYSPIDAQVNCPKNNFKIYVKINIKTAPICFGAVTPSSGSALLVLAKVTVVKIANGDVAAYISGSLLVCVRTYVCVYCRTVQLTHTNKDPLIYAATSPHTDALLIGYFNNCYFSKHE